MCLALSVPSVLMMGCSDELGGTESAPVGGAQVTHTQLEQGITKTVVDASSDKLWIYLRTSDGAQRDIQTPETDTTWDLSFQRYTIKLNGGVSGSGAVAAQWIEGQNFDAFTKAPAAGYLQDAPDGPDENDTPDLVFGSWYNYDFQTHVLTPRDGFFVVQTQDGQYLKLKIEGYYDTAGSPGFLSYRWALIEKP